MRSGSTRRTFCRSLPIIVFACPGLCSSAGSSADAKKVYTPGGDVTPPKLIHYVEPAFSASSKDAYTEGTVRIVTVVTSEGVPTDLHVTSGLNPDEDRTALEAVKQWRFQPGLKKGKPVNVRVTVEVEFRLL